MASTNRVFIREHGACGTKQMVQRFNGYYGKNEKRGIPVKVFLFFLKHFQWKWPFDLISHRNNQVFRTNGKQPLIHAFVKPIRLLQQLAYKLPKVKIDELQRVQNAAAKLILQVT